MVRLVPVYYLMSDCPCRCRTKVLYQHTCWRALVIHRDGPEQKALERRGQRCYHSSGPQHPSAETWGRSGTGVEARTDVGEIPDLFSPAERAPTFLKGCCDDAHAHTRCCLLLLGKGQLKEQFPPLVSLVSRLNPLCTVHFADRSCSGSQRQRTQLEDHSALAFSPSLLHLHL